MKLIKVRLRQMNWDIGKKGKGRNHTNLKTKYWETIEAISTNKEVTAVLPTFRSLRSKLYDWVGIWIESA